MLAGALVQAQAEMSMASQGAVEAAFIQCIGDLEADVNALFNVYLPEICRFSFLARMQVKSVTWPASASFLTAEVLYNMLYILQERHVGNHGSTELTC